MTLFYLKSFQFNSKYKGLFWFVLACMASVMGDVVLRVLSQEYPPLQVAFFRFFFGYLLLWPLSKNSAPQITYLEPWYLGLFRALLLVGAYGLWTIGLTHIHLSTASLISLSIPLWVLLFSSIYLREHVGIDRLGITLLSLGNIYWATHHYSHAQAQFGIWCCVGSTMLYAALEVFNKSRAHHHQALLTTFATFKFASLLLLPFAAGVAPRPLDWLALLLSAVLGSVVSFSLLTAYESLDMSYIAPLHYVEWPLALAAGFIFFHEPVTAHVLIAVLVNLLIQIYWISRTAVDLKV